MAQQRRATKARTKSKARPKRKVLRRKNLPVLALAGLFCIGIFVGAYLIDNAYQMRQEHWALQEAEKRAASEALAAEHARIAAQRQAAIAAQRARAQQAAAKPVKPTAQQAELATELANTPAPAPSKARPTQAGIRTSLWQSHGG